MKSQAAVGSRQRLCRGHKTESRGMKLWAKVILVTTITLFVSIFMNHGWYGPVSAQADVTAATPPTTASGWTNSTNVFTSNTVYATFSGTAQTYLITGTYGFSIPAGAIINGVQAAVRGMGTTTNRTIQVGLTTNGATFAGTAKTQALTATNTTYTLGTTSDLWGASLTPSNVNVATFGVLIRDNDATTSNLSIDSVALTITYTIPVSSSPLLHNSVNLDPTNAKGYGVWGVAGGTYGEFVCETCHSPTTTANIKKVVAAIPNTIGPNVNKPVTFNNMTGFGDDSISHATSTKICEVCHTKTVAHQYNTANAPQSNDLTHANGDCTQCHLHSNAFKASGHLVPLYATTSGHNGCASGIGCHTNSNPAAPYPAAAGVAPDCRVCHAKADPTIALIGCGSCHGDAGGNGKPTGSAFPNWSGSHTVHTAQALCTECHTAGGTGGNADHGKGNRNTNPAVVNLNVSYGWTGTTCSTASCHANPYAAAGYVPSPAWGTTGNGCSACHAAYPISTNGPATGSHALNGHKVACMACHATGTTATTVPSAGHADGNIDVANVGYQADAAKHAAGSGYTSCSAATCHGNVYGTGSVTTPNWGAAATGSCSVCHNTFPIGANGPNTGGHAVHAGKACTECHAAGTTATSAPTTGHSDGTIDVVNISFTGYLPNITKHAANSGYGTCSNVTCHSPYVTPSNSAVWGAASTCDTCHPSINLTGAHQIHMGTLVMSSSSTYYNMTANRTLAVSDATRKHGFGCANCHPLTIGSHLNGNIEVDMTSKGVVGTSSIRFLNSTTAGKLPSYTGGKCNNIYCHSNASRVPAELVYKETPTWVAGVFSGDRCAACHGNQPNTGAHAAHAVGNHYDNIYNGKNGKVPTTKLRANTAHGNPNNSTTIGCYICHNGTVNDAVVGKGNDLNTKCVGCHNGVAANLKNLAVRISNLSLHVNGAREIEFKPIQVLSKAQIRPKGANAGNSTFDFYSGIWTRTSYKNMSTLSYDKAKVALHTATMWHPSTPMESSCSNIACHNGHDVKWNLANWNDPNKCMDCHDAL